MNKSITELLEDILSAVYGEDVRKSIHDSIQKCYEDATKEGNANMEISQARGVYTSLSERLAADLSSTIKKINDGDTRLRALINSVVSGSPLVASSISGMTDTSRVYVNTTDGHWYWYDGSDWQDGGAYQSSGVDDEQVYVKYKKNETVPFDFTKCSHGGGSQAGSTSIFASRYALNNCIIKSITLMHAFELKPDFTIFLLKKINDNYEIVNSFPYTSDEKTISSTINNINWELGEGEYYIGFYSSANRSVSLNLGDNTEDNAGIYEFTYDSITGEIIFIPNASSKHYVLRASLTIETTEYFKYVTSEEFDGLEERVTTLEEEIESVTTLADYYKEEIERVKSISENQSFGLSFIFATDIHLRNENDLYKMDILNECGKFTDFVCLNGDIIDGSTTLPASSVKKLLADGINRTRNQYSEVYCTTGNHEDNFYGVQEFGDSAIINNLQFSNLTQKGNTDAIYDINHSMQNWYYVDFPLHKIRVIFFNFCVAFNNSGELVTQDAINDFRIPNEEILWMRDKALCFEDKEDKEQWAIIVCSHCNPVKDSNIGYLNLYNVEYFSKMLQAFKNGISFTIIDGGAGYGTNNVFDFTEQGPMEVIGVFSGHAHLDVVSTTNEYGITCINTCNDLNRRNDKEGIEVTTLKTPMTTKNAPIRTDGTVTTEAFDIVKIDRKNKKVICTRFGAGNSREVFYA